MQEVRRGQLPHTLTDPPMHVNVNAHSGINVFPCFCHAVLISQIPH